MKTLILVCSLFLFGSAAEAQTSKGKKKKARSSRLTTEAKVQMRLDSLRAHRQAQIDSSLAYQLAYDSARKENERLSYEKFQEEQALWKENKLRELDSANKVKWETMSKEHEEWTQIQNHRKEVTNSVKLSDYQDRQVNIINQQIFDKAKQIDVDSTLAEDQKKQQLVKLNEERRDRIRAVVGKSKERKIEKARKSHVNPQDKDAQWLNEIDGYVKN